jgi:hypothetical protein
MSVKPCANVNRTVIKEVSPNNMASDFTSDIIDFRDMKVGSLQVLWEGANQTDGYFQVFTSDFSEPDTFDDMDGSREDVLTAKNSRVFNLGVLGFRYALVKWFHGSVTTGKCQIVAVGKK